MTSSTTRCQTVTRSDAGGVTGVAAGGVGLAGDAALVGGGGAGRGVETAAMVVGAAGRRLGRVSTGASRLSRTAARAAPGPGVWGHRASAAVLRRRTPPAAR